MCVRVEIQGYGRHVSDDTFFPLVLAMAFLNTSLGSCSLAHPAWHCEQPGGIGEATNSQCHGRAVEWYIA